MSSLARYETALVERDVPLDPKLRAFCESVLREHSRSFDWAARFLPVDARGDAAVVYAFCRTADDVVDECDDPDESLLRLTALRRELLGRKEPRPVVAGFLNVAQRRNIELRCALELLDGIGSDVGPVRVDDDRALLRYCYRVAGTVGLMMAPLIGVAERRAYPHAIDLGVGMQLTNICRDVLEDAGRDRVYLPEHRLQAAGTSGEAIVGGTADPGAVAAVVCDLLQLADAYYASADEGMRFISPRCRLAILVASRVYHAIGRTLRKRGGNALAGRTVVGPAAKTWHVMRALSASLTPRITGRSRLSPHDARLHAHLMGLPGTHGLLEA